MIKIMICTFFFTIYYIYMRRGGHSGNTEKRFTFTKYINYVRTINTDNNNDISIKRDAFWVITINK